jgi:hypothetical protein
MYSIYHQRVSYQIFYLYTVSMGVNLMEEEVCLVDSGTTNSILRETNYFQTLTKRKGNVLTITGRNATIVGSGRATIVLAMGTQITVENALLYPDSKRTLLSYRDICQNGFHIETRDDNNEKILLVTKNSRYGKRIVEKILFFSSGLYYTYIKHHMLCTR